VSRTMCTLESRLEWIAAAPRMPSFGALAFPLSGVAP
jgi:hypothetical protein